MERLRPKLLSHHRLKVPLEGTMLGDALNVLRSLIFFVGLIIANIYILLQRKESVKFATEEAEGTAV
jgi:hypothetical protein